MCKGSNPQEPAPRGIDPDALRRVRDEAKRQLGVSHSYAGLYTLIQTFITTLTALIDGAGAGEPEPKQPTLKQRIGREVTGEEYGADRPDAALAALDAPPAPAGYVTLHIHQDPDGRYCHCDGIKPSQCKFCIDPINGKPGDGCPAMDADEPHKTRVPLAELLTPPAPTKEDNNE